MSSENFKTAIVPVYNWKKVGNLLINSFKFLKTLYDSHYREPYTQLFSRSRNDAQY